jgi:hypothetical protein
LGSCIIIIEGVGKQVCYGYDNIYSAESDLAI